MSHNRNTSTTCRSALCSIALAALLLGALSLAGCNKTARGQMHDAQFALMAQDYGKALEHYEAVLLEQPDSKTARFGKAQSLYGLKRYEEALPVFEEFLTLTDRDRATYKGERFDAEFFRDRCKQELGLEVAADPSKIPPPPMGE